VPVLGAGVAKPAQFGSAGTSFEDWALCVPAAKFHVTVSPVEIETSGGRNAVELSVAIVASAACCAAPATPAPATTPPTTSPPVTTRSARHVIYQGAPFSGDLGYPVFSPDGKQLVFERTVSGFSKPAGKQAVFVMGADGSNPRRITPWAENDGDNPDWSPDGKWIIFHSHVDDPSHQSQIYLIHPDGTGRKQLTHFKDSTHVASSTFSPDGKWIAISKGPEGGNIDVYVMRLDGTNMRRVTHSKLWESAPDWGPR